MKNKLNVDTEAELELSRKLEGWVVSTPLPPRFQEHVWDRIASAETRGAAGERPGLVTSLFSWLARPAAAYTCAGLLLMMGILSGSWAAQWQSTKLQSELGHRYVQAIDPTLHVSTTP